jgi:glycosyltransferase involved in cell wall biosynthesis
MRIIQAMSSSRRGGAERFFTRLVKAFHERCVSQTLLLKRKAWATEELSEEGIGFKPAWFAGRFDIVTRGRFRCALRELSADVAMCWGPAAAAVCPSGDWIRVGRLGKFHKLDAFASCDHLIANSPRIVAHIKERGWPAARVSYIPNFVPEIKTQPVRRSAFNTPDEAPLIVWLGRMTHEKGPDVAVRALAGVPGAYLWMAGAGPLTCQVRKLAAQLGVCNRIRFLGRRDDVHALLEAADIFVCTSRKHFSANILDAWSHALPLVSTRAPGTEHVVAEQQTGLLAANDEPEAVAAALNMFISNPDLARSLGAAGKWHFKATFTEEAVVGMYLDLCERLRDDALRRRELPMLSPKAMSARIFAD